MLSVFSYPGGKYFLLKELLELIPEHKVYVEVFGGSAKLLMNKMPSEVEVYNDIDIALFNLLYVMKDKKLFPEFIRQFENIEYSESVFNKSKKIVEYFSTKSDLDDNEKVMFAINKFINIKFSFNGNGIGFSEYDNMPQYKNYKNIGRNYLLKFICGHKRLENVILLNEDFRTVLNKYNDSDTFIYLDPPYLFSTRSKNILYNYEMSDKDHEELLDLCLKNKSKILITGYKNELYKTKLKEWNCNKKKVIISMACIRRTNGIRKINTEFMWYNYDINTTLFNSN